MDSEPQVTNAAIAGLLVQEAECNGRLKKIRTAIEALRGLCNHGWQLEGHDSHRDWYLCKHCGASEWR